MAKPQYKIFNKKPSEKAVLHSAELSVEFISTYLEKLREIFNDCGYDLHQDVLDPILLKTTISEAIDNDHLLSKLCGEHLGVGYLLGCSIAVLESNINDDMDEE